MRSRKEDIEDLICFFIKRFSMEMGKKIKVIEEETKYNLVNYNYPGNIRELKNIIERLVVMSNEGIIKDELFNTNKQNKILKNGI